MSNPKLITARHSNDALPSSGHPKQARRLFHLLMVIPLFFSCQSQSSPDENINCNKHDKGEFSACILKNFPVGSDYHSLSKYMEEIGFIKTKDPKALAESRFYFLWIPSGLNLGNYKVAVAGWYDKNYRITYITVS